MLPLRVRDCKSGSGITTKPRSYFALELVQKGDSELAEPLRVGDDICLKDPAASYCEDQRA